MVRCGLETARLNHLLGQEHTMLGQTAPVVTAPVTKFIRMTAGICAPPFLVETILRGGRTPGSARRGFFWMDDFRLRVADYSIF
jgi:hypothetical protein